MIKCKMPNFIGVFSFIQNAKIFRVQNTWRCFFWLLTPKSIVQNGNSKKFRWYLISFCKMVNQNIKFFGPNEELNRPYTDASCKSISNHYAFEVMHFRQIANPQMKIARLKSGDLQPLCKMSSPSSFFFRKFCFAALLPARPIDPAPNSPPSSPVHQFSRQTASQ